MDEEMQEQPSPEFLDEVQQKKEELEVELVSVSGEQEYWAEQLGTPFFEAVFATMEENNQKDRLGLETAKSEEVKRLQANIKARNELRAIFEDKKSFSRVEDARTRLDNFLKNNGMFLSGIQQ
jgi:hypothetical protein